MYYYKEVKKIKPPWGKILRFLTSVYLHWKIDIHVSKNDTNSLNPSYLVLANHVTYWDPFLVNMFVEEPICYIAEAVYFRNPLFRLILNSVGSIPKKRYMKQYLPIKRLLRAKDNGRILGIFPEGERKWDGTTDFKTLCATAKLIKKLDVPVVTVKIRGGYLAYPRWAKVSRKGRVDLSYTLCLTKDECRALSLEQIEDKIKQYLAHDEVDYQRKEYSKYIGKDLAENLEHLLFTCPNCQSLNTLISHGNQLSCQQCHYSVIYNQYGFLEGLQKKLYFDNLRDWNRWQNLFLREFITEKYNIKNQDCKDILRDNEVEMFVGSLSQPFAYMGEGNLCLNQKELYFEFPDGEKCRFQLGKITGLSVQFQAVLEFNYHDKKMYRCKFKNPHLSAYKWVQSIGITREKID
ncbi:MAG: lysophospholipid acyltransferase family protein [Atribacterota bacterium]|jgi:1-acyl-sn-glycerol-3-phosphate acyltransferase|nr:lysophospholipid acyltransferase family protein [Atribacterota bacterium]MDD4895880.1 lysophospholipid acyltransferase family protein [Atribacterota bacterium]MDD5637651.1 lysophospholipid acyltransferase family protein [Atribacterota bacterium]